VLFGVSRPAGCRVQLVCTGTAFFVHLPVRPLLLSPTACRYFAPPTPYRPVLAGVFRYNREIEHLIKILKEAVADDENESELYYRPIMYYLNRQFEN
jgi:hypothetical protein